MTDSAPRTSSAPSTPSAPATLRLCGSPGRVGGFDAADFLALAEAVRDLGLPAVDLTAGQRILLHDLDESRLAELRRRFPHLLAAGGELVHACPGPEHCRFAQGDAPAMAARVQDLLRDLVRSGVQTSKCKAGVSGCAHCCAESRVRDLGLIAGARGWTLLIGGNAGARPRIADELGRNLDADRALDLARAALARIAELAKPRERTARTLARVGLEAILDGRLALGEDIR